MTRDFSYSTTSGGGAPGGIFGRIEMVGVASAGVGSLDLSQPPPSASISATLATKRFCRVVKADCSAASSAASATTTEVKATQPT